MLKNISRRSFLVSSSAVLALPTLEAVTKGKAEESRKMFFIGQGYGFTNKGFYPTKAGKFSENGLPSSMKPLTPHINDICMVDRLNNLNWYGTHSGSDGFLKAGGTVSCDILAGSYLSKKSRYQNLVVNTSLYQDGHGRHGLSWDFNGSPVAGIKSSLGLYEKLFGGKESKKQLIMRIKERRSVLDSIKLNSQSFSRQIASSDKEKLEEYFQSIRHIEQEISKELKWIDVPKPKAPFEYKATVVAGKGENSKEMDGVKDIKLVYDMIALALQTGQTNVASFTLPNQAVLTSMGITKHIHQLSHYNASREITELSMQRDTMNMTLLSYALSKFKETKDTEGKSLFDNSVIFYGTNLSTGHSVRDVPFILSGGAMKRLRRGEYIIPSHKKVPLGNAWLTVLQETGVEVEKFGHSTGPEHSFIA